jgi:peptide/nickel transport system permease protein
MTARRTRPHRSRGRAPVAVSRHAAGGPGRTRREVARAEYRAVPARPGAPAYRARILLGLMALLSLLVLAVAGPSLTRWSWTGVDFDAFRRPPSADHWLGTTPAGRDVLAITLHGLRTSLVTGLAVAVTATGLAAVTGTVAGYFGGGPDRLLTYLADLLLVLPPLLAVATVSPALRRAHLPLSPVLAALMWMVTARAVRGATASLRAREHVLAARHLRVPALTIIRRHIVPHLAGLLIADATLNVGAAVVGETTLSYLGLGVRPPGVSLGTIIADGAPSAIAFPWLFVPPVVALIALLFGVSLVGDGLRDALDPGGRR